MKRDIELIINGAREKASIEYITEDTCSLTIKLRGGRELTSDDFDVFQCLRNIRSENKDVIFLCKGAKRNVYPSNMTRQMARGVIAYEYKNSEPAKDDCLVNIFDFDDVDVDTTPKEQELNHRAWIESLRKSSAN